MREATSTPWWRPESHADRRPGLLARNRMIRAIRDFLEADDFVEVETACLQVSPGNEAHLHAFATQALTPAGEPLPYYLHTSPEFACKKLLAAGETRIFSLGKVWRNRERGPLHHPEFTMLEWYRAGESYERLMEDCQALAIAAVRACGGALLRRREAVCDPFVEPERLSVAAAFERHARIDLLATISTDGAPDLEALARQARDRGYRVASDDTWSDIFSRILVQSVEPALGQGRLTILDEYPIPEAALARPCPDQPRSAERFELYACGVELANAFGELTDPVEQRRRLESEMDEKARIYGERYPLDEEFLQALAIMPPACGAALGVDRLVMLALGAPRIDQVIWTPVA